LTSADESRSASLKQELNYLNKIFFNKILHSRMNTAEQIKDRGAPVISVSQWAILVYISVEYH